MSTSKGKRRSLNKSPHRNYVPSESASSNNFHNHAITNFSIHNSPQIESIEITPPESTPIPNDVSYSTSINSNTKHSKYMQIIPKKSRDMVYFANSEQIISHMPNSQQIRTFDRTAVHWKGTNTLLCNGRCIGGPETWKLMSTIILIIIPSSLYLSFPARILWFEYENIWQFWIGFVLILTCVFFLILTAQMDPGIIPRFEAYERATLSFHARTTNAPFINPEFQRQPFRQTFNIGGKIAVYKYCQTCRISRPPRAFHCQVCNNCVERFDHHCPWVGNCIGFRNYQWFVTFLLNLNILIIYIGGWNVYLLKIGWESSSVSTLDSFLNMCHSYPVTFALACFQSLVIWFPIALLSFHIYIASHGQTTYEILRSKEVNAIKYELNEKKELLRMEKKMDKIKKVNIEMAENLSKSDDEQKNDCSDDGSSAEDIILDENYVPELRHFRFASPYSLGICCNLWNIFFVFPVKNSNIHIYHQPPPAKPNEAYINKRTIVYLSSQDIQHIIINNQRRRKREMEDMNGNECEHQLLLHKMSNEENIDLDIVDDKLRNIFNLNGISINSMSYSSPAVLQLRMQSSNPSMNQIEEEEPENMEDIDMVCRKNEKLKVMKEIVDESEIVEILVEEYSEDSERSETLSGESFHSSTVDIV